MWANKIKFSRPKYCYFKDNPEILYTVFEIYQKQNKIGFWHDPARPKEMPVIFEDLSKVELIWGTRPRERS